MLYRLSGLAIMAALFPAASVSAQSVAPTSGQLNFPAGLWTDADRSMVVRMAPCAGSPNRFCGTLVQDNRPGPAANPANHLLIRDLAADRAGFKGKAVDGGMTVNLTMRPGSANSAQVRFCLGIICETETWQRSANDQARR